MSPPLRAVLTAMPAALICPPFQTHSKVQQSFSHWKLKLCFYKTAANNRLNILFPGADCCVTFLLGHFCEILSVGQLPLQPACFHHRDWVGYKHSLNTNDRARPLTPNCCLSAAPCCHKRAQASHADLIRQRPNTRRVPEICFVLLCFFHL